MRQRDAAGLPGPHRQAGAVPGVGPGRAPPVGVAELGPREVDRRLGAAGRGGGVGRRAAGSGGGVGVGVGVGVRVGVVRPASARGRRGRRRRPSGSCGVRRCSSACCSAGCCGRLLAPRSAASSARLRRASAAACSSAVLALLGERDPDVLQRGELADQPVPLGGDRAGLCGGGLGGRAGASRACGSRPAAAAASRAAAAWPPAASARVTAARGPRRCRRAPPRPLVRVGAPVDDVPMPSAWTIAESAVSSGASWYAEPARRRRPRAGGRGRPGGGAGLGGRALPPAASGELVAGGVERLGRLRGRDRTRSQPLVGQHEVGRTRRRYAVRRQPPPRRQRPPPARQGAVASPVADAAGEVSTPRRARARRRARRGALQPREPPAHGGSRCARGLPLPVGTRSTLMRSRHRRNSFTKLSEARRVALTNYTL